MSVHLYCTSSYRFTHTSLLLLQPRVISDDFHWLFGSQSKHVNFSVYRPTDPPTNPQTHKATYGGSTLPKNWIYYINTIIFTFCSWQSAVQNWCEEQQLSQYKHYCNDMYENILRKFKYRPRLSLSYRHYCGDVVMNQWPIEIQSKLDGILENSLALF